MSTVTEQQVVEALSEIKVLDTGKSVLELGLIQGLQVKEGHVGFSLEVDPSQGEAMEPVRDRKSVV